MPFLLITAVTVTTAVCDQAPAEGCDHLHDDRGMMSTTKPSTCTFKVAESLKAHKWRRQCKINKWGTGEKKKKTKKKELSGFSTARWPEGA